jgi:hypothetical protein
MERFPGLFFKGLASMACRPLFATGEHDRTSTDLGTLLAQ